jgi:nitrite reductase/ring-hydroxylating ferredoxin subunit
MSRQNARRPADDACTDTTVSGEACASCTSGPSRRAFLRDAALAAAGILGALGLAPTDLAALPVRMTTGRRAGASELRFPLPAVDGADIDRDNEIILVRWQGAAYAFALSCPHQRTMLKWLAKEQRFQCPKHKSRYRPDGAFISGRATRGMDRYPVRRQGNELVVNIAVALREDEAAARWNGAVVKIG